MAVEFLKDLDVDGCVYGVGTIDASDKELVMDIKGAPAARIAVSGTFTGALEVTGFDNAGNVVRGGRLVFKSGIGSAGEAFIYGDGAVSREYAICGGSRYLSVRPVEWVSGSVQISMYASQTPFITFVNGAVHNAEEEAIRAKRSYLAGVADLTVSANQQLDYTLENPSGSGVNIFLGQRLFGHNGAQTLYYRAFVNPTADLATTGATINRYVGGAASAAVFKYEVRASGAAMGGIEGSGEPIHADTIRERDFQVIVPPGVSLGFSINGAGENINQATKLYSTLQWFEELIS